MKKKKSGKRIFAIVLLVDNGIDTDCLYDALEYSYDNETEHNQYTL